MDQKTLFDFCARHSISKMDMQYRDSGLTKFGLAGMGLAGEEPTAICKLEMPLTQLTELAKFELEATQLFQELANEAEIQFKNPAVANAYAAYKILLNLSQEEPNEPK